jgi:hypothetical protein
LSDEESRALVASLQGTIRAVDPEALSHPEHWWAVIFEQMRDGLM